MNIQQYIVTSENWTPGREGNTITGIVLHTMVGTTQSAYNRFNDPSSQVSVHYGVSLDGSLHQWVDEANTAWQAGNWDVNLKTIGIEHEDNGNPQDSIRTPQLYQASAELVADICKRYNIPCDTSHIFLHKDVIDTAVYPGGTACPDALDTNKIISMAQAILQGVDNVIQTPDEAAEVIRGVFKREPTAHEVQDLIGRSWYDAIRTYRMSAAGQTIAAEVNNFPVLQKQVSVLQLQAQSSSDAKLKSLIADLQAEVSKYK